MPHKGLDEDELYALAEANGNQKGTYQKRDKPTGLHKHNTKTQRDQNVALNHYFL